MAKLMNMHVDIVSAEEAIFSGRAQMVVARGTMGDLGITAGHAPLLTLLLPGPVKIVTPTDEEVVVFVSGGILEVQPDIITILADTVVRASDLNEAEILKAKQLGAKILAENCGQTYDKVMEDFDRDYWMDATESKKYGIVDGVLNKL